METITIWKTFNSEIYFFILKKVKNKDVANEILQNSFLKIHQNINQLKDSEKVRAWSFQIVRNEIANHFNNESKTYHSMNFNLLKNPDSYKEFCCFDRFISNLPKEYKEVIELVYIKGKKQNEVAELVGISLANVKARIRRAKAILKINFNECCKFELNEEGKLTGESNCAFCD
ncbi:MAG: sigma-70 family RNA polymerase sigma factor [Bacteroidota bacterium]